MNFDLERFVRPNVWQLEPYASARDEFQGQASIFIDANENPFETAYNRYPDPLQKALKAKIASLKQIETAQIFVGNGSDEAIDLLFRVFCEPNVDNCIITPPTYGMYKVSAETNAVQTIEINQKAGFEVDSSSVLEAVNPQTKLVWLCSPNNPTANVIDKSIVREIVEHFQGIVVIDEAYVDFAADSSFIQWINKYPNLVILQTFSKAWGMAGLRLGMAFAQAEIIQLMNKIKPPYNVNSITQRLVLEKLQYGDSVKKEVDLLLAERQKLSSALIALPMVKEVYPSDANFLLVKFEDAKLSYNYLTANGIVARDRSRMPLCEGCLRITVGSPEENRYLLAALEQFDGKVASKLNIQKIQTAESPLARIATVERRTKETDIYVQVNLDGEGLSTISTGIGFFDHMLDQIARHGQVDLTIKVDGDLEVDEHHTIEDTALALGQAFKQALGDKRGIERYGFCLPMDDALAQVALDFGGRNWLVWDVEFRREMLGGMPTEMLYHFFKSFSDTAACNLNIKAEGQNEHHKIEAVFKAFAKSIKQAVARDFSNMTLPSTKGML